MIKISGKRANADKRAQKWRRVEDLNLWWLVTTNGFQPFTIDLSDNSPHEMVLILSIFSFLAERVGFEPT